VGLLDRIRASQAQAEGTDATAVASAGVADVDTQQTSTKPRQEWGRPGRCPECNGRGYLDHIDLVDRIMYQHCTECRHAWTITEAELVSRA
jgi:hypothetical protein